MDKKLTGQVAIVTGASSGIGAGVAKSLAADGAIVYLNYPSVNQYVAAESIVQEILYTGGIAAAIQCDVTSEKDVITMFDHVKTDNDGRLDILVNNAGIQKDAPFQDMTLDQWNTVIGVNLTGQFLCAREAIRCFLNQEFDRNLSSARGKILHISSVHEVIPWAGHVNYATSKGGIMLMMKSLAQEFAPKKIRINSICPGAIQTPINRSAWETPEALESLLTLIPYNRIGQPQDIGKAAAWLCSDESDYITGTSIFIDGGMTLYPGFSTNG